MNTKPGLKALTELLGVVMTHDPVTMSRTAAVYERRTEPRKALTLVPKRKRS